MREEMVQIFYNLNGQILTAESTDILKNLSLIHI